jgi:hypothetical protein
MQDEYDVQLAADLVGHQRFTWMDGMLDASGHREGARKKGTLPVLSDFGTAGCLLALIDALGVLTDVVRDDEGWIVAVDLPNGLKGFASDHLGEAGAWALLEAWAELGVVLES